jgi:cob(I)alamin adenosyltransferase
MRLRRFLHLRPAPSARRAEREMVALKELGNEHVSEGAVAYINRLSDFFFVASRWVNATTGVGDTLWVPGKTR